MLEQRAHLVDEDDDVVVAVLDGPASGDELEDDDAEAVDVALLVDAQALARELGRHVPPHLLEPAVLVHEISGVGQQPRQAEVGHHGVAPVVEEDVAGLHAVVGHRRAERVVQVRQPPRRAGHDPEPLRPRQSRAS